MLSRTCAVLLATALTTIALPAAAQARGSISYDGTTMTFTGDAAADQVGLGVSQGELSWTTSGLDAVPAACRTDEFVDYLAYCPFPQRIVVDLGGGADGFSISSPPWDPFPAQIHVTALGGDGDDRLQSAHAQDGGPGNDRLEGHDGDQTLHGGPGDDVVDGGAGNDQVFGDDGNDQLNGDMFKAPGTDVIDGGPGEDRIESEWAEAAQKASQPVTVTLDGVANDGRPGENDNVVGVERFKVFTGGTFHGTDGVDTYEIEPGEIRHPATVLGKGGNDRLIGDDDVETIDGGPGDDYLEGGWNNDTIVGGAGRDTVFADDTGAHCNYWTWCRLPFGNDTVDVRDGEVDTVDCGIGNDVVKADPVDVVTGCETVDTGAAAPPVVAPRGRGGAGENTQGRGRGGGGNSGGRGGAGSRGDFALRVAGGRLGPALRNGLFVRFAAAGAGRATVTVKRGRTTVAAGSVRVRRAGAVRVRARFSRAGKRALRSADRAVLKVQVRFVPKRGGTAQTSAKTVTLARR